MLTASVVVHKTPPETLSKAIHSLLQEPIERIYIVDNSPDNLLQKYSEIDSKISYIKTPNKGYGAAHNIAIKKAFELGADYHLIMNPDVYWEGKVLTRLMDNLKGNQQIGLIAPQLLYPDGSPQRSVLPNPTPFSLIKNRLIPFKSLKKPSLLPNSKNFTNSNNSNNSNYLNKLNKPNKPNKPNNLVYLNNQQYLLGAFMLFRIDALKDIGLFDERFFLYPEDIDISRRMKKNWDVVYNPEVSVYHEYQRDSAKKLRMFIIHCVNMIRYFNKWGWFTK